MEHDESWAMDNVEHILIRLSGPDVRLLRRAARELAPLEGNERLIAALRKALVVGTEERGDRRGTRPASRGWTELVHNGPTYRPRTWFRPPYRMRTEHGVLFAVRVEDGRRPRALDPQDFDVTLHRYVIYEVGEARFRLCIDGRPHGREFCSLKHALWKGDP